MQDANLLKKTWWLMVGRKQPKSEISQHPVIPFDTMKLAIDKDQLVSCWYIKSAASKGTVIMFHGLNSEKSYLLPEAYAFHEMGFNVMMVDFRGHGESYGHSTSIGVDEIAEVRLAYERIRGLGENNLILYGMSLGATTIAKAIHDHGLKPDKVIMDMPFDRLQDHFKSRAKLIGFPGEPFAFFVTGWTGIEHGYWGYGHQTSDYVRKIDSPVLLQWGERDKLVTEFETRRIFDNIPSGAKRLVVYGTAGHSSLLQNDELRWKEVMREFVLL